MDRASRSLQWMVWGTLALVMGAIALLFVRSRLAPPPPVLGTVNDFTLTNQHGRAVSLQDLRGRVWVADIIFTRCAGPCLKMTRCLREVQQSLAGRPDVALVSITTDPDYDTPAVLQRYAARFRVDQTQWHFLTGPRSAIQALATRDLMLMSVATRPEDRVSEDDLFLHSTKLVVLDRQGRLRGLFDGEDPTSVARTVGLVRRLLRER